MSNTKVQPDPDKWIKKLDRMLKDSDYSWAWDYLERVRDWIAEHGRVTTGQMEAINNIKRGGDCGQTEPEQASLWKGVHQRR